VVRDSLRVQPLGSPNFNNNHGERVERDKFYLRYQRSSTCPDRSLVDFAPLFSRDVRDVVASDPFPLLPALVFISLSVATGGSPRSQNK